MHLLIPFAAPLSGLAPGWLADLPLPHLQRLLAQLDPGQRDPGEEDSLSPPHERALARALGWAAADGQCPWAAWHAHQNPPPGVAAPNANAFAWLTLCHWQPHGNGMSMTDPAALALTAQESAALHQAMAPYFEQDGLALWQVNSPQWLVQGADLQGLRCGALDRVIGRQVEPWLPQGPQALKLLRLQNEMQMLLYTHPVNDARAERRQLPINSFWLSGAGTLPPDWVPPASTPTVLDGLRAGALGEDPQAWRKAWQALDAGALAQAYEHVRQGGALRLTLCGERHAAQWQTRPASALARWWRGLRAQPVHNLLQSL